MTTVGFDFGTTNSLVAVPAGNRMIPLLDERGLPTPSVVAYEGERTIVGQPARELLDSPDLGLHGNIVRSPKFLLRDQTVDVGGVARSPVDIVADVLRHVREGALQTPIDVDLMGLRSVVVTIPVQMTGEARSALRQAFARAGMEVKQFIHEPLAALYGHLRASADLATALRERDQSRILVADWGGGTLDLTLCELDRGHLVQIRNAGTTSVGGDHLDVRIRNRVLDEASARWSAPRREGVSRAAHRRLLAASERAKIKLSDTEAYTVYVPSFTEGSDGDLELRIDRAWLDATIGRDIAEGVRQVEQLLEEAAVGVPEVDECLLTGGMANMPSVAAKLRELFGPRRVAIATNSTTMIAEGAAWVAADEQPLVLAKDAQVSLARQSFLELFASGDVMPTAGNRLVRRSELFCADPRDGHARFELCSPTRPGRNIPQNETRRTLERFSVRVDDRAAPFRERIHLEASIDEDLILHATATSSNIRDTSSVAVHDLEFALSVGDGAAPPSGARMGVQEADPFGPGDLVVRSNLAPEPDDRYVPGELLYQLKPGYFARHSRPPEVQVEERLYYKPCAVCGRRANHDDCRCGDQVSRPTRRTAS